MTAWPRPERLVSLGSIVADIRIEVPRLPPRGGDVVGSAASVSAGGAFNVLAAAARNGLPSAFGGRHGIGPYGARIRAELEREGIATLLTPSPDGDSGFCLVMVEPDGERTFVTSPGVEARIGGRKLASLALRASDAIFVSGYDLSYPELGHGIAGWCRASEADALLVVDPGPLIAEIPADVLNAALRRARIVTLNRREAGLLTRAAALESIGAALLPRLRDDAVLIVRDGQDGCFLFGADLPEAPVHMPAPPSRMLDSTGAGDTHTGVFVAAIAKGLDFISAARRANAAAAISVTRRGPATAPTTEELDAFLTTWPQYDPRSRADPSSYEPAAIDNRESEP